MRVAAPPLGALRFRKRLWRGERREGRGDVQEGPGELDVLVGVAGVTSGKREAVRRGACGPVWLESVRFSKSGSGAPDAIVFVDRGEHSREHETYAPAARRPGRVREAA